MLEKEFNEIFKVVEDNWFVGLEVKLELWQRVKSMSIEIWRKIINDILLMKKKPVLADFIELIREHTSIEKERTFESITCGECGRRFTPPTEFLADMECCPACYKYLQTPEGRAKVKQRKAELLNKISGAVKNTDMDTAIIDEPEPEPEPDYPFELGDDGVPF